MITISGPYIETINRVLPQDIMTSRNIIVNLDAWVPGLFWLHSIEQDEYTSHDGQLPIAFVVDTIDLPTATSRWKVSMPEYPDVTFDDIRAGKRPKLTKKMLEERSKALEIARSVRDKIDIRPLTTSAILRQLREGKSNSRD